MTNILIVDDQAQHLEYITSVIEANYESDFEIFIAIHAKAAIEIAKKESIDLVITDWEMPGMDGIELIKQLKQIESTKNIPIIMCTGIMTSSTNLKMALEAGAVDFICKPIDDIELMARVNSMLKFSQSIKAQRKQEELLLEKENLLLQQQLEILTKEKNSKDNEVLSKALHIIQLNELIKEVANDLIVSMKKCPNNGQCESIRIKFNIEKKLNNPFWEEFEAHLNLTHHHFYDKLCRIFPDLTTNEKRLCSLIYMNLSSKEISNITSQNASSIDIARYRLRKKLNLDKNQNLYDFLKHFDTVTINDSSKLLQNSNQMQFSNH